MVKDLGAAYDLNPSIDKGWLALNIDMESNALDYELAKSVGDFFQLREKRMDEIIKEVRTSAGKWRKFAAEIGIARAEQDLMAPAFELAFG